MRLPHCSNASIRLTHTYRERYFLLRLEIKDRAITQFERPRGEGDQHAVMGNRCQAF